VGDNGKPHPAYVFAYCSLRSEEFSRFSQYALFTVFAVYLKRGRLREGIRENYEKERDKL